MKDVVLLVEDDHEIRGDLALLIQRRGHEVVVATDGRDALDKLARGIRPSLILLDLMMPEMDGWEFRAELLKNPRWARVPVVLLSATSDIAQEAKSLAAVGYLTKPVVLDELFQLLDTYCRAPASD